MNWTNRFIARTGKLASLLSPMLAALAIAVPALADAPLTATYQGQTIRFTQLSSRAGAPAIGVNDPGFAALLSDTGAFLTWKPGERYVLITTSVPTVVSFAIGDRRYDAGPIALQASFAPFLVGDEAYLPLREVLRALDLALHEENGVAVLQPQLAALDVRQEASRVTLFAHGGAMLHARIAQESPTSITYAFDGVGTTLSGTRQVGAGGIGSITITNVGSVRDPITLVTVQLQSGTIAEAPQNIDGRDVLLAFDGAAAVNSQQAATQEASPTPEPPPDTASASGAVNASASGPAIVTGVTVEPAADGVLVAIAIAGSAAYEWHRLREPDNRFWVDIANAQLQGPPTDQTAPAPLLSLRVRQVDPTTVRIALSLSGPKPIAFTSSADGLDLAIGTQDVAGEPHAGSGSIGGASVAAAPLEQSEPGTGSAGDATWKFGPRAGYAATNPRLIVIDPGHGGSDVGTMHGGVSEAQLTLDMAKRLRTILIGRGWEVKMTRESDVDVYAPNDTPRDELQARDDIANKAGARLFVSIHANAFINSGPYGTTCYISKPDDAAFARIVEAHLAADGTKDDGIVKSHLYVTLHARMPAVLIETAFLTNPGDYALLTSSAWRQKVAQEIADGIGEYAQEYPVPDQPAQ
ncbi:MAG TPA: N-acetylmuramoyl-L-alanine amidase [Candidatus Cybelea sp.]|nr:N-acetylmuramoyl-L-alanine amidase [Candidatus Cybelea sp.]